MILSEALQLKIGGSAIKNRSSSLIPAHFTGEPFVEIDDILG
jgi:hypothetical protein